MYVYVTQLYSGETKPFQGDEEYLKRTLLAEYPFLYRYTNQHMPLTSVLRELSNSQAYHVETDAKPEDLQKKMGDIERAIGHDTNANAHTLYDHSALLASHPAIHQAKVDAFENNVNKPTEPIAPISISEPAQKGRSQGIEGKAFYKHAGGTALVKGGAFNWQKHDLMGGFNEMTSQAAYHAGGIGHLHQAVHATFHEGDKRLPAIVIHTEPQGYRLKETVLKERAGKSPKTADRRAAHREDFSKMAIMDHLLGNFDRHAGNFFIKPNGQPVAIDNGGSFTVTGALDKDAIKQSYEAAAPGCLDFSPETINWWHANKKNIVDAVRGNFKHVRDPLQKKMLQHLLSANYRNVENRLANRTKYLQAVQERGSNPTMSAPQEAPSNPSFVDSKAPTPKAEE